MRGKYSPTVNAAYRRDQFWWDKYAANSNESYPTYDPEGYDSYGYNKDDCDRAGNFEHDYYLDDEHGGNSKYEYALDVWGFDGIKPIVKQNKK
jgi:hypothetical protein